MEPSVVVLTKQDAYDLVRALIAEGQQARETFHVLDEWLDKHGLAVMNGGTFYVVGFISEPLFGKELGRYTTHAEALVAAFDEVLRQHENGERTNE